MEYVWLLRNSSTIIFSLLLKSDGMDLENKVGNYIYIRKISDLDSTLRHIQR